jgi:tRNA nucleotidyltransferase (CCA-adding enzyme)
MTAHWEHFKHEADIGLRGVGASLAEAFEQAALALTAVITDPETVRQDRAVVIECAAPDDELLLVDWLNALVYQIATHGLLFGRYQVRIVDHSLHATCWGEPLDRVRHEPVVEIKGATYTALSVQQVGGQWLAQTVVDV